MLVVAIVIGGFLALSRTTLTSARANSAAEHGRSEPDAHEQLPLTIRKLTPPDAGAAGPFVIDVTRGGSAHRVEVTSDAGAGEVVVDVGPGTYLVTESSSPAGWTIDQSRSACVGAEHSVDTAGAITLTVPKFDGRSAANTQDDVDADDDDGGGDTDAEPVTVGGPAPGIICTIASVRDAPAPLRPVGKTHADVTHELVDLTIRKATETDGSAGPFAMDVRGAETAEHVELTTVAGVAETTLAVAAGTYTISESAVPRADSGEWHLDPDRTRCEGVEFSLDDQDVITVSIPDRGGDDAGASPVCTLAGVFVTDPEPYQLTLRQQTPIAAGDAGPFGIDVSGDERAEHIELTTHDGRAETQLGLEAGLFVISESALPDGWSVDALRTRCEGAEFSVDREGVTTVSLPGTGAHDAGSGKVVCTVAADIDAEPDRVRFVLRKEAPGGDGEAFAVTVVGEGRTQEVALDGEGGVAEQVIEVAPGIHTIADFALPAGSTVDRARTRCDGAEFSVDDLGVIIVTIAPEADGDLPTAEPPVCTVASRTEAMTADLVIARDGPEEVVAGEAVTSTLTVANDGPQAATGIVVTDVVPVGFAYDVPPGCVFDGDRAITCEIEDLAAGADATISIKADIAADHAETEFETLSNVTGDQADPAVANNNVVSATPVARRADLEIANAAPASITAGHSIAFTLDVTNTGPSEARDVVVTDVLPGGVSFATTRPGCTLAAMIYACAIGDVGVGESVRLVIDATLDPSARGPIANESEVISREIDPHRPSNAASTLTQVTGISDLSILREAPPAATPGSAITFTLTAANVGPSDARDVIIVDSLPAAVVPARLPAGCSVDGPVLTCKIGDLVSGASTQVRIDAAIDSAFSGRVVGAATVAGDRDDPDLADNTSTTTTEVAVATDVEIAASAASGVVAGEPISFELVIMNHGPADATAVEVYGTLPPGLLATAAPGGCSLVETRLDCSIGDLGAGARAVVEVPARVRSSVAAGVLETTAAVTAIEPDSDASNNASRTSTAVAVDADVAVSITDVPGPLAAGAGYDVTTTIENRGPSDARAVTARITLPTGFELGSVPERCALIGTTLMCALGDLAVGAAIEITVPGVVRGSAPAGSIGTAAAVVASTPDTQPADDAVRSHTMLTSSADLSIIGEAPADTVAGEAAPVTLTIANAGPSDARGVVVADHLPRAAKPTRLPAGCSVVAANLVCAIGHLGAGSTTQIDFEAEIDPTALGDSVLENVVTISATTHDPDPADNVSVTITDVGARADPVRVDAAPIRVRRLGLGIASRRAADARRGYRSDDEADRRTQTASTSIRPAVRERPSSPDIWAMGSVLGLSHRCR